MDHDEHISIEQAAEQCIGNPSPGTVWRWADQGIKSRSGEIVKLKTIRVGGRIYTTIQWLHEFHFKIAKGDTR